MNAGAQDVLAGCWLPRVPCTLLVLGDLILTEARLSSPSCRVRLADRIGGHRERSHRSSEVIQHEIDKVMQLRPRSSDSSTSKNVHVSGFAVDLPGPGLELLGRGGQNSGWCLAIPGPSLRGCRGHLAFFRWKWRELVPGSLRCRVVPAPPP